MLPIIITEAVSTYEPPEPGIYQPCIFESFTETTTEHGAAYRWAWKAPNGKTLSDISDRKKPASTKNKTGRYLAAISGQPLAAGVSINPEDYIGKKYLIVVGPEKKIETFSRLD